MKILQIGQSDWSKQYKIEEEMEWFFLNLDGTDVLDASKVDVFDATILEAPCDIKDLETLEGLITPYTLLVNQSVKGDFDGKYDNFFQRKVVRYEDMSNTGEWLGLLSKKYFSKPYGSKLPVRKLLVSPMYKDKVWFEGSKYLSTQISNINRFRQLFFWKLIILYENQYDMDLWLEYKKEEGCSIELDIQFLQRGSSDEILSHRRYTEEELSTPLRFSNSSSGYLVCSIFAKGSGLVKIGSVHYRHSRLGAGEFLPGGKRLVDQNREELFYYFYPGNLKPPFNIYFSGYRTVEGFEGYHMMKELGHPFLLITDPRLEGGDFYIGSQELERQLEDIIRKHIELLGFQEKDVIFSGISMGSFGALYYGSRFKALAIILGKPIIDLEYVAQRARLIRPYEFLTILDMVKCWEKTDEKGIRVPLENFTKTFLSQWSAEDGFGNTQLLLAHMEQDDYDDKAYYKLLKTQSGKETTIIARGYQGRHNDRNAEIVTWFVNQYQRIIQEYVKGAQ